MPSLEQLLGHRFFTQYATDAAVTAEKPHFKLSLVCTYLYILNINITSTFIHYLAERKGATPAGCFEERFAAAGRAKVSKEPKAYCARAGANELRGGEKEQIKAKSS